MKCCWYFWQRSIQMSWQGKYAYQNRYVLIIQLIYFFISWHCDPSVQIIKINYFPSTNHFLDCQSIIKWLTAVIPSFQVLWLRLRLLVLRGLALAVSLVPKPQQNMQAMNNGTAEPVFPLEQVITELTEVLQEIDKHPGTREKVSRVIGAK